MKIAILIPTHFDVAALWRVRALCHILAQSTPLVGGPIEIAVGLPSLPEPQWRAYEQQLRQGRPEVVVRHLSWEQVPAANAGRMFMKHQLQVNLAGMEFVTIPRDWGWNFTDCDVWINFADPGLGAILPLKPLAHYVSDLAVRIVPDAYAKNLKDSYWKKQTDAFRLWRQAGVILASEPWTADDIVGYAGVRRDNVIMVPSLISQEMPLRRSDRPRNPEQWVWMVEPGARHGLSAAAAGLQLYLQEGGRRRPILASKKIDAFGPKSKVRAIKQLSPAQRELLASLPQFSYHDQPSLSRLLFRSGALWSSEVAGGEGFAMLMAARHGMLFLGQEYPLHTNLAAQMNGGIRLYNKADPIAIADALHTMESTQAYSPPAWQSSDFAASRHQQYSFVLDRLMELARG